jgi:hypothetical protein
MQQERTDALSFFAVFVGSRWWQLGAAITLGTSMGVKHILAILMTVTDFEIPAFVSAIIDL